MAMIGLSLMLFGFGGVISLTLGMAAGNVWVGLVVQVVAAAILLEHSIRSAGSVRNWLQWRAGSSYGIPAPAIVWVGVLFSTMGIMFFGPMKIVGPPPPVGTNFHAGISVLCIGIGIGLCALDDCFRGLTLWTGLPSFRPYGLFHPAALPAWGRLAFGNWCAHFSGAWIATLSGGLMLGLGVHAFVWGLVFRTERPHADLQHFLRRAREPRELPARVSWREVFNVAAAVAATVGGWWMFAEIRRADPPGFESTSAGIYALALFPLVATGWLVIVLGKIAGPRFLPSLSAPRAGSAVDPREQAAALRGWACVLLIAGAAGIAASWVAAGGGGWIAAGMVLVGGCVLGLVRARREAGSFAAYFDSDRNPSARFHPLERAVGRPTAGGLLGSAYVLLLVSVYFHLAGRAVPAGTTEFLGLSLGLLGLGDLLISCAVQCLPPPAHVARRRGKRHRRKHSSRRAV